MSLENIARNQQRRIYAEAVKAGAAPHEALQQVVDWLIAETVHGL